MKKGENTSSGNNFYNDIELACKMENLLTRAGREILFDNAVDDKKVNNIDDFRKIVEQFEKQQEQKSTQNFGIAQLKEVLMNNVSFEIRQITSIHEFHYIHLLVEANMPWHDISRKIFFEIKINSQAFYNNAIYKVGKPDPVLGKSFKIKARGIYGNYFLSKKKKYRKEVIDIMTEYFTTNFEKYEAI